jgi:hypothetical protein
MAITKEEKGFITPGVNVIKHFSFALMIKPNKLEHLSLETNSSQVLNLRARPEPTQLEHLSDASILGKILVCPPNVILDWKVIASYKHSCLFYCSNDKRKKGFYDIDTRISSVTTSMTASSLSKVSQARMGSFFSSP